MAKKLILVVKSRDEMGAVESGVVHDLSVAGGEAVWEVEWTACEVAGSVTHPFLNRHM